MDKVERNLGPQPVAEIIAKHSLKPHDLVVASEEHLTHKMISRACKGRRLTVNVQKKVLDSLNCVTEGHYTLSDLFNYPGL